MTGPSAFNALAHCVEALYAPGCNPVTSALALEGVRAPSTGRCPTVMHDAGRPRRPLRPALRRLPVRHGAGRDLGAALHHKLCHVLGGRFDLVHADAHSVVLPHAVACNAPALPAEMARLAEALGVPGGDPAGALWDLAAASEVPTTLAELGLRGGRPARGRRAGRQGDHHQPVPVDAGVLLGLLQRAYAGTRPGT